MPDTSDRDCCSRRYLAKGVCDPLPWRGEYRPTWGQYSSAILLLAAHIKALKVSYDAIVGVSRGGLVAATILSHILSIKGHQLPVHAVSISTYEGEQRVREGAVVGYIPNVRSVLVVDDIISSGKTVSAVLKYIRSSLQPRRIRIEVASVYVAQSKQNKYLCGAHIEDNVWVVFPYEAVVEGTK